MRTSVSEVLESIAAQPRRPEKHYHWEPFHQLYSCNGRYRIELFLMQSPEKKRVYVGLRNFETHTRGGAVVSEEGILKLASKVFSVILGGLSMPISKKTTDKLLEFYFKPRRKGGPQRYIYRAIIHDILRDNETYAREVSKRYGVNPMWAANMLRAMEKAEVLKQNRKVGRTIMYTFALDKAEVKSLIEAQVGIMNLRKE